MLMPCVNLSGIQGLCRSTRHHCNLSRRHYHVWKVSPK